MARLSRREFVTDVARGMVVASVGSALAGELLSGSAYADAPEALTFGPLEPLVALMQEMPADRLMATLAGRLRQGTELRDVLAAGALANARTFGGEDYVGFHTMMALAPAWYMSRELPEDRRAVPVLKVLHRNATRMQETGGRRNEVLRPVRPADLPAGANGLDALRAQVRRRAVDEAERTFAALARGGAEDALNAALYEVEDATEVHRVVLPYRAWDLAGIIGREQAHTLLRQSIRYCVRLESPQYVAALGGPRTLVPRLLDQHRLVGRRLGSRTAEDAWVERMVTTFLRGPADRAADAAAAALAEGMAAEAVGEAICLAANQLVLRDPGRAGRAVQPNRPAGSVHGDSIGVHASDSANAWRNLARAADPRNAVVCLILGAYQVALDTSRQAAILDRPPYPTEEARAAVRVREPEALLRELNDAVRAGDQNRAAAVAHVYGEGNPDARPIFAALVEHAVRDEGALHGEKYYRTVSEEFAATRPAFRWRQVVALARVVASAAGRPDPGHAEVCRVLGTGA